MELIERIQQLEQRDKTLMKRIAALEAKLNGDRPKKPSKYVSKIKGRMHTKDDAHRWIDMKFNKNRAA